MAYGWNVGPAAGQTPSAYGTAAWGSWVPSPDYLAGFTQQGKGGPGTPAAEAQGQAIVAQPPPVAAPVFNPYADYGYIAGASAVDQQAKNAQANLTYGNLYGSQQYGYDPSGQLVSDQSNPAYNPYSQAAILQRNYDNTQRGTTNSYAASGQLYSGALLNKRASDTYGYNQSSDALQRSALNYFQGLQQNYQGVQRAGQTTLANLIGGSLNNFTDYQSRYG